MRVYASEFFENEARKILGMSKQVAKSVEYRRLRCHFGVSFKVCADVWERLDPDKNMPTGAAPAHLLWACMFLKLYEPEHALQSRLQKDEKTIRKWVWIFVNGISSLSGDVVRSVYVYTDSVKDFVIHSCVWYLREDSLGKTARRLRPQDIEQCIR